MRWRVLGLGSDPGSGSQRLVTPQRPYPGVWAHPGRRGGRPCVDGTSVMVSVIRGYYLAGDSIETIALAMRLTHDQVEAALRYCLAMRCAGHATAWVDR